MKLALHSFLAAPYYANEDFEQEGTPFVRVVLYEPVAALRKELRAAHKRIEELEPAKRPKRT
jgi:hypothetical protein